MSNVMNNPISLGSGFGGSWYDSMDRAAERGQALREKVDAAAKAHQENPNEQTEANLKKAEAAHKLDREHFLTFHNTLIDSSVNQTKKATGS